MGCGQIKSPTEIWVKNEYEASNIICHLNNYRPLRKNCLISLSPAATSLSFLLNNSVFLPSRPIITKSHHHLHIIHSSTSMDSTTAHDPDQYDELAYDYSPYLKIYKNGRVQRLLGIDISPPSLDPITQVQSKDVIYSPNHNLSSRLYLPKNASPSHKLPLLVYYHGGGFCIQTPYTALYHRHLNNLVAEANVVAVSVDYRLAPEHPLPASYDDSWASLKWAASHILEDGPEEWLNKYADFDRVFLAGDSAGANIAHRMALRNGENSADINLKGTVLVHPYFWGKDPIGNEPKEPEKRATVDAVWYFACPGTSGNDDPWINPLVDPNLSKMGCSKVLVMVAGKDILRDRGLHYYEKLKKSGYGGSVEFMETTEEDHVFHFKKSDCDNAAAVLKRIASFINQE